MSSKEVRINIIRRSWQMGRMKEEQEGWQRGEAEIGAGRLA
jgi:hypothetical protein